MSRKRSKEADGDAAVSEGALATDVAAFAAEIGLAPQDGAGRGFDDSDFRPELANVKIGEDVKTNDLVTDDSKQVASKKKSKNKFKPGAEPEEPARPPAAVTERTWNEGAGSRPGGKSGKSLLGEEDSAIWYEAAATVATPGQSNSQQSDDVIEVKTKVAERLIEAETNAFSKKLSRSNNADFQWLQTVRRSGTSRDKIAANALVVEQNALANMSALDDLIALASKRGGAQGAAGHAVDALKELFMSVLLPDRRLVTFETRPLSFMKPSKASDRQLLFWWVEDCIKRRYAMFIKSLEDMATGSLDWAKEKALKAAAELLAAKPEAEAKLLALIVNKLGDPSRRVASNAGYNISRLLTQHPLMGMVVVREVETFLFRPNQKARARYYAVVTLNQMVLTHHPQHGGPVAAKLIDIYFTLFQLVLDGKLGFLAERSQQPDGDADADKSHTRVDDDDEDVGDGDDDGDDRGGRVKGKGKGERGQRGRGKAQGGGKQRRGPKPGKEVKAAPTAEEVDARLLGALLTGVRRAHPYVEAGVLDDVFKRHADQVFRTVHVAPLTVSSQALMLLFQVMNSQAASSDRFYATLYAVLLRPGLDRSSSISMIFGLLFQAMKTDTSSKRVAALIKRLLQVASGAPPNVACGALFIVSEVLKSRASLWAAITQPEDHGEDRPQDAPDDPADAHTTATDKQTTDGGSAAEPPSAVKGGTGGEADVWPKEGDYSMQKRSPQFAGAERACWWELCVLRRHVHPSVATMAGTLLAGTSILYNGDPIADLTTLAFLEKFVKRRAKRADKGSSVMQPVAALDSLEVPTSAAPASSTEAPQAPGSTAFAALAEADVAAEDVFFHRYFTMDRVRQRRAAAARTRALKRKAKKKAGSGSEDESDEEDVEGGDDGSAAEEDFLDDLEQLPDDALGDPDAGLDIDEALAQALESENHGSDEVLDDEGSLDDEDVTALGDDSDGTDEMELVPESELEGLDMFALPAPSDVDSETTGEGVVNDQVGLDIPSKELHVDDSDGHDSSIDEEGFAKAMFGPSDDDSDEAVQPARDSELSHGLVKRKKPKRKKGKGSEVFADYEQYAHLLDNVASGDPDRTDPSRKRLKKKR